MYLTLKKLFTVVAVCTLLTCAARAELLLATPHDVDKLPNGNILITDGGTLGTTIGSRVIEVSPEGKLINAWLSDMRFAHNADPTASDTLMISDTGYDRVIEVDASGAIVWNSDDVSPLSDGSSLNYPNDANLLPSGNILITDRNNHRVLEINRLGTVVWQFGITSTPGAALNKLNGPHNADRLLNGNTLVADSNNHRILEIDPFGSVVWLYKPAGGDALNWPRDADRLSSGNTLITDSKNNRIVEADGAGNVVWELTNTVIQPYDADRLDNGNTLISDPGNKRVIEVDASGTIVWNYPGAVTTTTDVVWIHNPTSGVNLHTHIHKPADAGPDNQYPAFVYVPGGSGSGAGFHLDAQNKAAEGFIAVHFDPDGRGLSTNGGTYTIEDYCGFIQQDGLQKVVEYVANLPETDRDNIGIFSQSYGVTMASGMLARHQDSPPVRWFMDYEGPADRNNTAKLNGGHVPVDPSNNTYWAEREAITFMPHILPQYIRLQSEGDHNPAITDNHHAINLINGATNTAFTGQGISPFTRVNRDCDNGPNQVYTLGAPPTWYPDHMDDDLRILQTLMIHERMASPTLDISGNLVWGGSMDVNIDLGLAMANQIFYFAFSWGDGPVQIPGYTEIHLDLDSLFFATLFPAMLSSQGHVSWNFTIPYFPNPAITYYAQAVYVHPNSSTGWSATTGVCFEVIP